MQAKNHIPFLESENFSGSDGDVYMLMRQHTMMSGQYGLKLVMRPVQMKFAKFFKFASVKQHTKIKWPIWETQ